MKILTRLSATLGAGTERAVARFENHDAIAAAAVRGAREAVATARVRHARLVRDGEGHRTRLAALVAEETRWGERARRNAPHDEADALACLDRRRATRARIDDARRAFAAHERLERETAEHLETLERRLAAISRRRDALRSRESIARAGEVLDTLDRDDGEGLEDVFDRWEVRIAGRTSLDDDSLDARHGIPTGGRAADDSLARRHADGERDAALRAELAALLGDSVDAAGPGPSERSGETDGTRDTAGRAGATSGTAADTVKDTATDVAADRERRHD